MRTLRFLPSLAALLALVPAAAQQADAPAALTSVRSIRELDPVRLDAGEPVRLEGVVIFPGILGFTMHDGESGIQVSMERGLPRPGLGERVRVEGTTGSHRPDGPAAPLVIASGVESLGPGTLPEPVPTSVEDLARFRHWENRVSVEAWVLDQSWDEGGHHLFLADAEAWAVVHVRNSPRGSFPRGLVGARIRATGVNQGYNRSALNAMMLPGPEHWSVVEAAPADYFDRPSVSAAELTGAERPPAGPVRIRGRVADTSNPEQWYLRDESGIAFRLTGILPLPKPAPEAGERSASTGLPPAVPGDEIEAVGFAVAAGPDLWMRFCQARVIESGEAPAPLATTFGAVLAGKATNQLATLAGRLLEKRVTPLAPGRFRARLVLEDQGGLLVCRLDSPDPEPFADLRTDDLVEVTGLVSGNASGVSLQLRSAADAVSRGLAPSALFRRVRLWGGAALLVFALLALWVGLLRRSLRRTERAEASVRNLNATLEDRVRERTAELEEARAGLDRALGQERELGRLKSRFVAMVSHEFRTPLGMTMSALELLRHHRDRLSGEKQGELLEDIFSATLRMSGLMEQILILGRADAGKMNLRPAPLDLPAFVRAIVGEVLVAASRSNPVEFHFGDDLSTVSLDESLLRLILGNLVSNAVKYSPPGGVVRIGASREGGKVVITVADEGIGIPAEDQPRLFEAFHRAGNVGDISGSGLGLLLVKRCVELHQGTIAFESDAGRGTTFRVTLPSGPE